jgi:transposase-like protein
MKTRRQHSAEFKAKVALEAIKGERTLNEIAADYEVHPVQVQQWKKLALEGMASVFGSKKDQAAADHEALTAQLYQQIGQLKVEVDWLKKKSEQLRFR